MNKPKPLQTGDTVPKFSSTDQDGNNVHSTSLLGTRYLIFFYPRDSTPGCTAEACGMRDLHAEFIIAKTRIIGVSPDEAKSHRKFIEKNDLPFTLLCDNQNVLAKAFGVWGEKKFMGRTYNGVYRMSFLVGKDGMIEKTYAKVEPAKHAKQVIADLN